METRDPSSLPYSLGGLGGSMCGESGIVVVELLAVSKHPLRRPVENVSLVAAHGWRAKGYHGWRMARHESRVLLLGSS